MNIPGRIGGLLFLSICACAQSPPATEFFEKNIRPLLAEKCYTCHSARLAQPMSGLRLDTRAGMLRGGARGVPAVVPGKPEESLLLIAVQRQKELKMPPAKALEPEQVEALAEWIRMGAPSPPDDPATANAGPYDWEKARRHWAFRPVADPPTPQVASREWSQSPVDRFIKARLDEKKLVPQPRAGKLALIRRATYDLTGLPPTPAEIDAFLKDTSPGAFEKLIDRLLASRAYGEKWGRHWLDVVRYSDTAGDNSDFPVPSMYRYRNWVIDAFNTNKPYDQFLSEQLAGDILAERENLAAKDKEAWQQKIVATGYLANSRRFGSRIAEFHLTIDDTIDNLGKGLLGLSAGCARCHDHKFDPIPTADYYALYGIFKSSTYAHPGAEIYPHTYGFVALDPDQTKSLDDYQTQLKALDIRQDETGSGKIKFPTDAEKRKQETEDGELMHKLTTGYPYFQKAYAVTEGTPSNARIMVRGDPQTLGPEVPRGFLTILGGQKLPADEKGSGRLELAQWIADAKNPLTARVIVNRVWLWHFGQGIVATPDDFGARGEPPSHPELLDYLTSRFLEDGWSIKKLHKLIMQRRQV